MPGIIRQALWVRDFVVYELVQPEKPHPSHPARIHLK